MGKHPEYRGRWLYGCPFYEIPATLDNLFYEAFEEYATDMEVRALGKKMKTIVHEAIRNGQKSRVLPHFEVRLTRVKLDKNSISFLPTVGNPGAN